MAFVRPKARVMETSTTALTGPYALAGAIDTSFNRFSASMSIGDTTLATVVEPGVASWCGLVTYSAANQITLTTVEESKGTFGSGTKEIFMGLPPARAVYLDQLVAFTDATDATSSTAGAVKTAGGLAVAKKLFVGLAATIGGVFKVTDTTEATGAGTTASGIFSGGVEILKKLYVTGVSTLAGVLAVTNTTEATGAGATASGIFSGGVEILKKLYVTGASAFAGIMSITNGTASSSTGTGALVVTGGAGVGGAMNVGGAMTITGALTVGGLANAPRIAKAWVNFQGTGTVAIRAAVNVSSITDVGTGVYTVNFTSAMADANYAFALSGKIDVSGGGTGYSLIGGDRGSAASSITTALLKIVCNGSSFSPQDYEYVSVTIFGS